MYVYIESEPGLWTVGFFDQTGKWHPDSDHETKGKAASRVAGINGHNQSLDEALNSGSGVYRP